MNRLIIIIISLLLVIVFGFLNLGPKYQDLSALNERIIEKGAELEYQGEYFSDLGRISEKLEEHNLALSKINSAVPLGSSLPALLSFFQEASSQSGLIMKGIGPSLILFSEETPDIQETQFSLALSGSYLSFKEFLSILEESARLVEIDSISLSLKEAAESLFSFNLKIRVYSY